MLVLVVGNDLRYTTGEQKREARQGQYILDMCWQLHADCEQADKSSGHEHDVLSRYRGFGKLPIQYHDDDILQSVVG